MPWTKTLSQQGWVHLQNLVPAASIARLNHLIDTDLAAHHDPARQAEYDARSACPDLRSHPAVAELYHQVAPTLDRVLDVSKVSVDPGQIAIRWAENAPPGSIKPHIDGVRTDHNGLRGPLLATFTALVGVFLTPSHGPWSGNFTVWPQSTTTLSAHFRQRGRRALLEGMPPLPQSTPVQLEVKPGDVVIANYLLMHGCSPNSSSHQRRAVFFRVRKQGLVLHPYASLANPWRDWRLDY